MTKYLVVLSAVMLLVSAAHADPPIGSTPPGGWGTDCTNWITYGDPWVSNHLIYDPLLGAGGEGFRDCVTGVQVVWPGLDIEMWIEMECLLTWDATHAKIHRASDYEDFYLYFTGTSACNNGQWIITTPPTALVATTGLTVLPFVEDMFGRTGPTYGTDIPLTWEYNVDGAGYLPMVDGTDGAKQFQVDLCDHSFIVRVKVDVAYHQEDGYYYLGGPGASICPVTPL